MALFEHDDDPGFHFHESRRRNPYAHNRMGSSTCVDDCPACLWEEYGNCPYGHELEVHGMKCADDCPACAWVDERVAVKRRKKVFEMKERLGYPTEQPTPTEPETKWLLDQHILW